MCWKTMLATFAGIGLLTASASAQYWTYPTPVVVRSPVPVVTTPPVILHSPGLAAPVAPPVVNYRPLVPAAPVVTYGPVVPPVTTYRPIVPVPAPVVTTYSPAVTTYSPAVTAYSPVITPYSPGVTTFSPVIVPATPHVPGQPVRNVLRAMTY
jgi:hypothetical protein